MSLLALRAVHLFANFRQQFFRLSRLPLRVVETFTGLSHIELIERCLGIFNRANRKVQAFAGFAQLVELVIFGWHRREADRVHLRNLNARFSFGNSCTQHTRFQEQ